MNIALSASGVLVGIAALTLIIISLIVVLRIVFRAKEGLAANDRVNTKGSGLLSRTKYPEVNVFRHNGTLLRFGLAASLAFSVIAFSWTTYEGVQVREGYTLDNEDIIEIEIPRTDVKPPEIKPPENPIIEEVPEEEIPDEQPDLEIPDIEDDFSFEEVVEAKLEKKVVRRAPLPLPEDPVSVVEIFNIAEEMPRFPGCEDLVGSVEERKACSDKNLLEYLYKNLKYPAIARETGIEGRVYIQFVVEKDGSVSNANIVRDVGAGCGQSALKVVKSMNNLPAKWTPGKQRGSAVRVLYTLPVTFKLQH